MTFLSLCWTAWWYFFGIFFHFISMQHSKFWWLSWFLAQNNICLNICNTVYIMCLIISDNFRAKPNQAWASQYSSWNQADFMYINKKQIFNPCKQIHRKFPYFVLLSRLKPIVINSWLFIWFYVTQELFLKLKTMIFL